MRRPDPELDEARTCRDRAEAADRVPCPGQRRYRSGTSQTAPSGGSVSSAE
jgi:hypothetical protein